MFSIWQDLINGTNIRLLIYRGKYVYLHKTTSKQKTVFFECVSKCHAIHNSKKHPNVRLSKYFFNYKTNAAQRNWHKNISLTIIY